MPEALHTRHRVKELAQDRFLSIRALALYARISYKTTHALYHNPQHQARYSTWCKLAAIFGIPVAELVVEERKPGPLSPAEKVL